ncbi:MAG: DUF5668 domain-containing protein [Clostridium sp.]|uniref:LiaI-LiaF-like domain-containing protein n=1 Tax=Clostridium sp. TaxID=1506 RepID=UPI0039E91F89
MDKKGLSVGIILVIIGAILLLNNILNLNFFSISNFWPLFVLIPGLVFEAGYFLTKRNPGLLVPGGILTTLGLLFFFETFTGWQFAASTWPIYPLAVAIGLFQLYLFGYKQIGLLIPVFILGGISLISLAIIIMNDFFWWINGSILVPALFILIGIVILFNSFKSKKLY